MPLLNERDPLHELLSFHGEIRSAIKRLFLLVKAPEAELREGLDAFITFIEGPLLWHDIDEELSVFPRLRRIETPPRLQTLLGEASRAHEAMEDALGELLERVDPERPDRTLLSAAANDLELILQPHLVMEEQEIFPLARLLLEEEDLVKIRAEIDERISEREVGGKQNAIHIAAVKPVSDVDELETTERLRETPP
jgi:iron-sulfur cluster repair protein YtfE (RIC family)